MSLAMRYFGCLTTVFSFLNVATATDYLLAFTEEQSSIVAVSGISGGQYEIIYPDDDVVTKMIPPYSTQNTTVRADMITSGSVDNTGIVVRVPSSSNVRIYGGNGDSMFNLLPVSALGKRYMLTSCSENIDESRYVIIASIIRTVVNLNVLSRGNITFKGQNYTIGDVLSLDMAPFEAVKLETNSSITGWRVESSEKIAVYVGMAVTGTSAGYDQILPLELLGTNFSVAYDENVLSYTTQIVTVYDETRIFSISFSKNIMYTFKRGNGFHSFNTTKPVVSVLCTTSDSYGNATSVLPSKKLFQTEAILPLLGRQRLVIHVSGDYNDVKFSTPLVAIPPVTWLYDNVSDTSIGTISLPNIPASSLVVKSTRPFYIIVISENTIYNSGYSFSSQEEDDEDDNIIFGVAAGVGISTAPVVMAGGFFMYRRRQRRLQQDNQGRGDNQRRGDNQGGGNQQNVNNDNNEDAENQAAPQPPPQIPI